MRHKGDLKYMHCPEKYKKLGSFFRYFNGDASAPCTTILIGGNHENSKYFRELYYGGWIAPKIYFLGYSGVVKVNAGSFSLRVGGISGIYKEFHYHEPYFEREPYSKNALGSLYHTRILEVLKLGMVEEPLDVVISHEWPDIATLHGDVQMLLKYKPWFKQDVQANSLGSPALSYLIRKLRPSLWASAHLHCHFRAEIPKADGCTKFIGLDKILPRGGYMEVLKVGRGENGELEMEGIEWEEILKGVQGEGRGDIQGEEIKEVDPEVKNVVVDAIDLQLFHDKEWLSICKLTDNLTSYTHTANLEHLLSEDPLYLKSFPKSKPHPPNNLPQLFKNKHNIMNQGGLIHKLKIKKNFINLENYKLHPNTQSFIELCELYPPLFAHLIPKGEKGGMSLSLDPRLEDKNEEELNLDLGFGVFEEAGVPVEEFKGEFEGEKPVKKAKVDYTLLDEQNLPFQ